MQRFFSHSVIWHLLDYLENARLERKQRFRAIPNAALSSYALIAVACPGFKLGRIQGSEAEPHLPREDFTFSLRAFHHLSARPLRSKGEDFAPRPPKTGHED
jgi:hypothetical protein